MGFLSNYLKVCFSVSSISIMSKKANWESFTADLNTLGPNFDTNVLIETRLNFYYIPGY